MIGKTIISMFHAERQWGTLASSTLFVFLLLDRNSRRAPFQSWNSVSMSQREKQTVPIDKETRKTWKAASFMCQEENGLPAAMAQKHPCGQNKSFPPGQVSHRCWWEAQRRRTDISGPNLGINQGWESAEVPKEGAMRKVLNRPQVLYIHHF